MIHVVFIFSQLFVVSMGMVSSKTVKCQQGWKGIKGIKKKTGFTELSMVIREVKPDYCI